MHFPNTTTLTAEDSIYVSIHNLIYQFLFKFLLYLLCELQVTIRFQDKEGNWDEGCPDHTSADPAGDVWILPPWTAWPVLPSPPAPSTVKAQGLPGVGSHCVRHSWGDENYASMYEALQK